jgi:probable F420-dependent oxidoreductase
MTLRLTFAPWGESLAELVEVSRQAEAAGAEVVWVPEMHRSATVTAAAVAAGTSTVGVGTAIALAFTRSPMVTALEAMDLDELSGGRFALGLGTGVQRVNEDWHNAQWGKPVAHLRETINVIRTFVKECTTGEPMEVEGDYEHLRVKGYQRTYRREREEIPIYLAGVGPVMVKLAGETAQGWISHELCSPSFVKEQILPNIEAGLAVGGRQRSDIELVVSACAAVDTDGAAARRLAAGVVGFYATVRTYADFFAFHGFAEDQQRIVDAFRAGGVTAQKLGDLVPDPMVEAFTISGTPDQVRDAINAYDGIVDSIKLSPPTSGLAPEQTRSAQQQLLGVVADITGGRAPSSAGVTSTGR